MHITRQMHSDCQKLRRFALHLWAAGDLRRWTARVAENFSGSVNLVLYTYGGSIDSNPLTAFGHDPTIRADTDGGAKSRPKHRA